MPTVHFSLRDLSALVDRKMSSERLVELLEFAKGEVESEHGDDVAVKFGDTNLPFVWSVEGLALMFRGLLGVERGLPVVRVKQGKYVVEVEKNVRQVRPFISAFVARGKKVSEQMLLQLIQLQEVLCDNFGRRRKKVAIGVYPLRKIAFPVTYKAVNPHSVRFTPLEFVRELSLHEILQEHPKGVEFGSILEGQSKYPVLVDARGGVMSFPPVINAAELGKVEVGDEELFFEATGTDESSLNLVASIFAHALSERGFSIESVLVKYPTKRVMCPVLKTETVRVSCDDVENVLGVSVSDAELKRLLERMRYGVSRKGVEIPSFRGDILHKVDVIEDVAISYGYANISSLPLSTFTVGGMFALTSFVNRVRELFVGHGFQEVMSPILSNVDSMYHMMNVADNKESIVLSNPMSKTYSLLRSWLTPIIMDVFSKNKHNDYPQKVFEQGLVSFRSRTEVIDEERIAFGVSHAGANFTEVRRVLDAVLRVLGVAYSLDEDEHGSYIPGRVGKIMVNGTCVGYIGEMHPRVLLAFNVELPVASGELFLSRLFEVMKK